MSFRGFGGVTRWERRDWAVWADFSAESGTRTPVNCNVLFKTWILLAMDYFEKSRETYSEQDLWVLNGDLKP